MDGTKFEKTQERLTDFWVEIFSMKPPEYKPGAPQTKMNFGRRMKNTVTIKPETDPLTHLPQGLSTASIQH